MVRLILNGKKAGLEPVRQAIQTARNKCGEIQVRVTWEAGDVARLVAEAQAEKVERIIACGGDGTINEVVDAVCKYPLEQRPEVGIMPLGTANDFATANGISAELDEALIFAASGKALNIDAMCMNDRHFVNMATAGFGAKVTAETPVELKNFLGGGAYVLSGLVQALNFVAYEGEIETEHGVIDGGVIVGAVCNGRQAGGGQQLAPQALIDDGQIDLLLVMSFPASKVSQVLAEIADPKTDGEYVKHLRCRWVNSMGHEPVPVNLDGEPVKFKGMIRCEVEPGALKMVLPKSSPLLSRNN